MAEPVIALGVVAWRQVEIEWLYCRDRLMNTKRIKYSIPIVGDALVSRARSQLATRFLMDSDADVLLSIDTDIDFAPEQALQICEQAMDADHSIVVGQYVTRGHGERCQPTSHTLRGEDVIYGQDPTLVEVEYPSGGFMAVHRRVFDRLKEDLPLCHEDEPFRRMYPFYQPFWELNSLGKMIYLSEDYALGARARDVGYKSYLNPAVRLGHNGVARFRLEDMTIDEPPALQMTLMREENGTYTKEYPDWKKQPEPVAVA